MRPPAPDVLVNLGPPAPELEDAFFAGGAGGDSSVPPATVSEDDEPRRRVGPDVMERRARFRRMFVGVVGACAILSVLAVARIVRTSASKTQIATATAFTIDMPVQPSIDPTEVAAALAAPPAEPEPVVVAPAEAASAAPTEPAPPEDALEAKRQARAFVDRGQMRDAIRAAEDSIVADPTDAEAYLLLGAALQETGQWKRSIEVFSRCAREATRGPTHECRALGGR